jgi:Zn-finger nucleic acid-binding protein
LYNYADESCPNCSSSIQEIVKYDDVNVGYCANCKEVRLDGNEKMTN